MSGRRAVALSRFKEDAVIAHVVCFIPLMICGGVLTLWAGAAEAAISRQSRTPKRIQRFS